jgi:hypothetical protein
MNENVVAAVIRLNEAKASFRIIDLYGSNLHDFPNDMLISEADCGRRAPR